MKIYRRGKIWWFSYMIAGKRYQRTTKTANKKEAEAFVAAIGLARRAPTFEDAVEVLKHIYRPSEKPEIKLEDAWARYQQVAKATGKDQIGKLTLERRRNVVERLAKWTLANYPKNATIERFTGREAAAFASDLLKQGLKSKTRKNIISELGTVWTLLGKVSPSVQNVWLGLLPRDIDSTVGKAFTPDDEARVLAAAKAVGKDWEAVCVIMRHTGLRYSDVARLRWDALDERRETLRLIPHKTAAHKIAVTIPLTEQVKDVLAKLPRLGDFLFPLHAELYDKRGRARSENLAFAEVLRAAGLDGKGYTIHSWRHTAATRLAATGADIETRKRILGHTVDETAERYDHDEHLDETRAALERAAQSPKRKA